MNQEPNMASMDSRPEELTPKAFRRGAHRAAAAGITAGVIALVVAVNILFSFVADRFMWQVDETVTRYTTANAEGVSIYTPTDAFLTLVRDYVIPMVDELNAERTANGEEPLPINVKFCTERDRVYDADLLRMIQYSVLSLQKEFPGKFDVSYINIDKNPSAVQKYKATATSHIYSHEVIFEFGTEYRVCAPDYFFKKSDENSTTPWAYNGEQKIASLLLDITRAVSPIAGFITNHGEDTASSTTLRALVENSGYDVIDIDLSKDEIPADCRLLICYDPTTDFLGLGNPAYIQGDESEIKKLDAFLDNAYSFMLFIDKDTPELPVLEEYLAEWGVAVSRGTVEGVTDSYTVRDQTQKLDKDGYTLIADYMTEGTGASLTDSMRDVAYPPKVIFPNATAISMAEGYRVDYPEVSGQDEVPTYSYGSYYRNGVSRSFHDVFHAGVNATADVAGKQYEIATEKNRFKLMTLSLESRTVRETNYDYEKDPSCVAVFASTEFASNAILDSAAYGNADVLSSTLRSLGREVLPANLELKGFKIYEVDTSTYVPDAKANLTTTVLLTLLPIAAFAIAGAVIHVKRKYR